MDRTRQIACCLLWLGGASGASGQFGADLNSPQSGQVRQIDPAGVRGEGPSMAQELIARQLKRQREEHQKQVYSDTARLLQLATELKAQVDHGEKPTPGELKEVDEIGKLAKRVSERIKTQ